MRLHPKPHPVSGEVVGHLLHQDVILGVRRNAGLFVHAQLVQHVHHAADAIFRQEYRPAVFSQRADHAVDLRRLRNFRVKMKIARTDPRWILHSNLGARGGLFGPPISHE